MIYSIYDKATGKILRIVQTNNDISRQLLRDEAFIEGNYLDTKYYVENEQAVEMPEKPTSPYIEFDYTTKSWTQNSQLAILEIRTKRRELLAASDWTDTLSAKTRLGEALYNQWQIYRQQLRDITTQTGYPLTVTWPVAPGSTPTT
jgi:hypothetical protein